jgi:hypothetical protein
MRLQAGYVCHLAAAAMRGRSPAEARAAAYAPLTADMRQRRP